MQKHEHTPENNMSPNEIALHQDIYNGEGSEGIDVVETFLAAKTSLHAQIEEIMQGGGESTEEVVAYLNSFLMASAQGFAKMLQLSEASLDDKLQFGATVLLQSLQEIEKISEEYGCDASIDTEPVELSELIEAMEEELEVARGILHPSKCILLGIPLDGIAGQTAEFATSLTALPQTTVIQNEYDPYGSSRDVKAYLLSASIPEYKFIEMPNDHTHDYVDFVQITSILG